MVSGALIGSLADLDDAGVGSDFLVDVAAQVEGSNATVVAEIDEDWVTPLDTRMEAIGGQVQRHWRIDVEDAQFEREIEAWNQEMDRLDAEIDQAASEAKAKLEARKKALQDKIDAAQARAKKKIDHVSSEAQAQIDALKAQSSKASAETKAEIEKRIEAAKAKHAWRAGKLKEAWQSFREAISS